MKNVKTMTPVPVKETKGFLHCPICTHTVPGVILTQGRTVRVKVGQKCPRCASSLDPAYILNYDKAA